MEWMNFLVVMGCLLLIYGIMAVAYNVQYGYTKMVNFGTVAWFAIGAYTYAILTTHPPLPEDFYRFGFGLPILVGIIGAGIVSGLVAYLIGLPILKLKGHYFAIVTFAFAEILRHMLINEKWLTNGTVGFFALRQPWVNLMSANAYTYFSFFLMVVALLLTYFLLNKICKAPFGRVLKGIRENDTVCLFLGKKVPSFKMKAFVITSIFMGIAGSLYASMYMTLVTPSMFTSMVSFLVLFAVVVGGKGNNKGAILGMFLLMFVDQFTRFIEVPTSFAVKMSSIRGIIYGLLLVMVLRFLPQGIIKEKKVIYNEGR
jgi:branched-chain amino acid transport system permease protein